MTPDSPLALQDHGVAGGQLTVHADALERALDGHAEQQVRRLGRQRGVGLHEAQQGGEVRRDHAGALGLRGQAHRARRRARRRGRRAWRTRRWSGSRRRSLRRRPRRSACAAATIPRMTASIGSGTPITPVEATATAPSFPTPGRDRGRALHLGRVLEAGAAGGGVGVARVDDHGADPSRGSARGTAAPAPTGCPDRVKRAALVVCGASETSRPRSGAPLGLIPHATPAARKPRGQPAGRLGHVGRAPRSSASGRRSGPRSRIASRWRTRRPRSPPPRAGRTSG